MLTTEVDAILRCDGCEEARSVVSVPMVISEAGSAHAKMADIILPDGWQRAENSYYKVRYLCPSCVVPSVKKAVYG